MCADMEINPGSSVPYRPVNLNMDLNLEYGIDGNNKVYLNVSTFGIYL